MNNRSFAALLGTLAAVAREWSLTSSRRSGDPHSRSARYLSSIHPLDSGGEIRINLILGNAPAVEISAELVLTVEGDEPDIESTVGVIDDTGERIVWDHPKERATPELIRRLASESLARAQAVTPSQGERTAAID